MNLPNEEGRLSDCQLLVLVRSIRHADVVRKRKANGQRTEWEQVASEEGILVTDAIRLMRQGDAIERLAGTGPSVKTEVADRLQAMHDTTPRSKIDDAAEVAVSIGEEILEVTREYARTQGAPGGFNVTDMTYASFYTHEGTDALVELEAHYPHVYGRALFVLLRRAEWWWRREIIPTQGTFRPRSESDQAAFRASLHYAALANDVAEILARLAAGEDPNVRDAAGFAPQHFAVQVGSFAAAEALLSHGAAVDAPNSFGNTPLHVAVYNCSWDGAMIALLRRHGADPLRSNHSGLTPLGLSRLVSDRHVVRYFADLP